MKEKIKKILFPFFKGRHRFLMEKWWFRLVVVAYVMAFVITPFIILDYLVSTVDWCYYFLAQSDLKYGSLEYQKQSNECSILFVQARNEGIFVGILGTLFMHYLIQLTFFKIVVDFIVLGGKKNFLQEK